MSNKIEYIGIGMLTAHPDNPRKDVGDVTELAASIKRSGVLQNLTVVSVPDEDGYTKEYRVVIGHRRLAAAQLAGLNELPCVVADMDYREQLATMLSENMQRADLTLVEQVEGIQLMLDLGESVAAVSELTGLSESTVRRRAKLAELQLPREALAKSAERGGRLEDYARLGELTYPEHRKKALEAVGTPEFGRKIEGLLWDERWNVRKAQIIMILDKWATRVAERANLPVRVEYYSGYTRHRDALPPEDAPIPSASYYYVVDNAGINVWRHVSDEEYSNSARAAAAEREAKIKQRKESLEALTKQAYEHRRDFVLGMSEAAAAKHADKLIRACAEVLLERGFVRADSSLAGYIGIDVEHEDKRVAIEAVESSRLLLLTWYALSADDSRKTYYSGWGELEHEENRLLDHIYGMLIAMGYEPTADEAALRDGTHELFKAVE